MATYTSHTYDLTAAEINSSILNGQTFGASYTSADATVSVIVIGDNSGYTGGVNSNSAFGLYITRDSGTTWGLVKMPTSSTAVNVSSYSHGGFSMSKNGEHMVCCVTSVPGNKPQVPYVYYSHDKGVSWSQSTLTGDSGTVIGGSCISEDGKCMYISSYEQYSTWATVDGGVTWNYRDVSGRRHAYMQHVCSADGRILFSPENMDNNRMYAYSLNYSNNYTKSYFGFSVWIGETYVGRQVGTHMCANEDMSKIIVLHNASSGANWVVTFNSTGSSVDTDLADNTKWIRYNDFSTDKLSIELPDATTRATYKPRYSICASSTLKYVVMQCSTTNFIFSNDYGENWKPFQLTVPAKLNITSMSMSNYGKLTYMKSTNDAIISVKLHQLIINSISIPELLSAEGGETISGLISDGYTVTQLLEGQVTIQQLLEENINIQKLLEAQVTIQQLLEAQVTVQQLLESLVEIVTAVGAPLADLLAVDGINLSDLVTAGAPLDDLLVLESVNLADLLALTEVDLAALVTAGVPLADLLALTDVTLAALVTAGAPLADLLELTEVDLAALVTAGAPLADLLELTEVTLADLVTAGAPLAGLVIAGVPPADLLALPDITMPVLVTALVSGGAPLTGVLALENVYISTLLEIDGVSQADLARGGVSIAEILAEGIIPDWNIDTDANHFDQSYVKGFVDLSGSILIRNDNKLITNGDLSLGGNLTVNSPGTTSFPNESMTLKSHLFMGEDISANGNVYIGGDLSVNGQFSGNFANDIIPLSAISSGGGGINISGNVFFADDVSFNGPTVDVNIPHPPLRISDSILSDDEYTLNSITYKLIPRSSPVAITDVYITSLDDIEPHSALITGSDVSNTFKCVFYKYETDDTDAAVTNNWICGHYESALNITRVCRIEFTLNGSISSIQQISRAYNKNYTYSQNIRDTNSVLGDGNYTSTAADLAKLFNDTTDIPDGFTYPIGSGPITTDLSYALTDFYYNTPLSTVQWDTAHIRESDLSGTTFTQTNTNTNTTYKLIPESSPAVITGLSIDSLDRIEPVSADMTGSSMTGGPFTCQGIYKYETDDTGAAVANNWIFGAYTSGENIGENITNACRIEFTLDGTSVYIQQISRAYNKNYSDNDTGSDLSNGNYTSTADDLAKLFNDTTDIPDGFTYPIGSGPITTDLSYALTNVYYNYKVLTNNLNSYSKFIPVSICDSVVGYILNATSITYKVLPLLSAVIPNATVYSLDQIELVKAYMTGPNINVANGPLETVIYKYQDKNGSIVPGNWICGATEIGGAITYSKAVLLEFTLNGTNISVKHVGRSFSSTNDSALGTSDYTSTAADLSRLFNDDNVSNIDYENGYAITDASIKVSSLQIQANQIEFNDGTTMTTHDDNILSGTFADSNVVFKDSTFAQVTCEGVANVDSTTKTSDYRIKENVTELNETDTVDALVPIQYNNTKSGNHEFGLLAHELQEVYPDLVVGEKDGAEYQRVHYNGLIGVLVKEIQGLKQRLAVLNNR